MFQSKDPNFIHNFEKNLDFSQISKDLYFSQPQFQKIKVRIEEKIRLES